MATIFHQHERQAALPVEEFAQAFVARLLRPNLTAAIVARPHIGFGKRPCLVLSMLCGRGRLNNS